MRDSEFATCDFFFGVALFFVDAQHKGVRKAPVRPSPEVAAELIAQNVKTPSPRHNLQLARA